jgi:hypothetical protein
VIGSDPSSVPSTDACSTSLATARNAAEHLRFFQDKTMILVSAVALARDG